MTLSYSNIFWRIPILFRYLLIPEFSYFSNRSYRSSNHTLLFLFFTNHHPWLILSSKKMTREGLHQSNDEFLHFSIFIFGMKNPQRNFRSRRRNTYLDRMRRFESSIIHMTHFMKYSRFCCNYFCLYHLKCLVSSTYTSFKNTEKNLFKRSRLLTLSLNWVVLISPFL